MENKFTKREIYNAIVKTLSENELTFSYPVITADGSNATREIPTDVVLNAMKHEIELLDKKKDAHKGELTDTQKENQAYGEKIVAYLTEHKNEMSTSALAKEFGLSTQRVAPIMKKLIGVNRVVTKVEKRVTYYSVPTTEEA